MLRSLMTVVQLRRSWPTPAAVPPMTATTQPDSSVVSRAGISRRSTGRIVVDFMRPLSNRVEGGTFPAALGSFGAAAERDAVEAAGHLRERGMGGEEQLGGADQPALLGRAYRCA